MSKSLLDLETARKELEELERERSGLAELIRQLKAIRDGMSTVHSDVIKAKKDVEEWFSRLKSLAAKLATDSEEALTKLSTNVESLRASSGELLGYIRKEIDQTVEARDTLFSEAKERFDGLEEAAKERFSTAVQGFGGLSKRTVIAFQEQTAKLRNDVRGEIERCFEVRKEMLEKTVQRLGDLDHELDEKVRQKIEEMMGKYEAFEEKHFRSLEGVTKAYDKMRINYDAMRITVKSVEDESGTIKKAMEKVEETVNNVANEIKMLKRVIKTNNAAVTSGFEKLRRYTNGVQEQLLARTKGDMGALKEEIGSLEERIVMTIQGKIDDTTKTLNKELLGAKHSARVNAVLAVLSLVLGILCAAAIFYVAFFR